MTKNEVKDPQTSENGEPHVPAPGNARLAALHTAAEAKRRETVERLKVGIAKLQEQKVGITAKAVEGETGLAFKAIQRNRDAYELFRQHAAFFQTKPGARQRDPERVKGPAEAAVLPNHPLTALTKAELIQRQEALQRRVEDLERALAQVAVHAQQDSQRRLLLQAELTAASEKNRLLEEELAKVNRRLQEVLYNRFGVTDQSS